MSVQGKMTNGSVYFYNGKSPMVVMNGTLIQLQIREPYRDSQLNELLYVIIVIVFYATALMTLIITQIRRQRREGSDIDYYDEYLQRNQEVKRTCQTAVKVFNKQPTAPPRSPLAPPRSPLAPPRSPLAPPRSPASPRSPAPPRSPVPPTLNFPDEKTPMNEDGGNDMNRPRKVHRERSPVHRERSPMLESIPDEEPLE